MRGRLHFEWKAVDVDRHGPKVGARALAELGEGRSRHDAQFSSLGALLLGERGGEKLRPRNLLLCRCCTVAGPPFASERERLAWVLAQKASYVDAFRAAGGADGEGLPPLA